VVVWGEGILGKVEIDHDELCEELRCAISDDTTICNHVLTVPARQKDAKGMPELRHIDLPLPSERGVNIFRETTI
jgi:hypothetical protein